MKLQTKVVEKAIVACNANYSEFTVLDKAGLLFSMVLSNCDDEDLMMRFNEEKDQILPFLPQSETFRDYVESVLKELPAPKKKAAGQKVSRSGYGGNVKKPHPAIARIANITGKKKEEAYQKRKDRNPIMYEDNGPTLQYPSVRL